MFHHSPRRRLSVFFPPDLGPAAWSQVRVGLDEFGVKLGPPGGEVGAARGGLQRRRIHGHSLPGQSLYGGKVESLVGVPDFRLGGSGALPAHALVIVRGGRYSRDTFRKVALFFPAAALGAAMVVLPAGSEIYARLSGKVASSGMLAGERVEAVVIAAVTAPDGRIAIPSGAILGGCLRAARPAAQDQRAMVELDFFELALPDGGRRPVSLRVTEVDNARESVDQEGRIVGILASETLVARIERGLERLAERFARLAGVLKTAKDAVLNPADTEITYEAGTDLTLRLLAPLELEESLERTLLEPVGPAADLFRLVNAQPYQTTAAATPKPSDVTNLMFLGSREQIATAFHEAGWSTAEQLNALSGFETVRAVLENRGYKEAPMSVLLLDGRKPDLVFQKQLNTFAKRHHLRIWKRPDRFAGREVWVAAATHDIGIAFSPENRTFIHQIDSEIDRERGKVVVDLVFTGRVKGLALVDRPGAPRRTENATGDQIVTDGRMAVLQF
jgi:hypothetical protein